MKKKMREAWLGPERVLSPAVAQVKQPWPSMPPLRQLRVIEPLLAERGELAWTDDPLQVLPQRVARAPVVQRFGTREIRSPGGEEEAE